MTKLKFNHESDDMLVAMGITEDQYDEILFKVEQIQKRKSRKSEVIESAIEWADKKFSDDVRLKGLAMVLIGRQIERTEMMESMHEMMGRIPDMIKQIKSTPGSSVVFDDQSKMIAFQTELKSLIKEYDGEEVNLKDGVMAIKLNELDRREFSNKLDKLKNKYGVSGGDDEIGMPMSFGGPIAEA